MSQWGQSLLVVAFDFFYKLRISREILKKDQIVSVVSVLGQFWRISEVFGFFSEIAEIKVVEMISNFERFQEILKQENSESYSSLSHVEPRNLPRCPKLWPR